jgi:hypothetical protein
VANFALSYGGGVKTDEDGHYTTTDIVVAIILAVIAAVWMVAYGVAFVQSGAG